MLAMAERAASIRKAGSVGGWLYGVAHKLSVRARNQALAQRKRERQVEPMTHSEPVNELTLQDIETWELNEAFATQVLGCLAAWNDEKFCKEILGLPGAAGEIDRSKLNVDGGAISLGHPVGTSGNRIVLHLINAMKRLGTRRGIATECIGGGLGGAMLIEAV